MVSLSASLKMAVVAMLICLSSVEGARIKRRTSQHGFPNVPEIPISIPSTDDIQNQLSEVLPQFEEVAGEAEDVVKSLTENDPSASPNCKIDFHGMMDSPPQKMFASYSECLVKHCENMDARVLFGALDMVEGIPSVGPKFDGLPSGIDVEEIERIRGSNIPLSALSNADASAELLPDMIPEMQPKMGFAQLLAMFMTAMANMEDIPKMMMGMAPDMGELPSTEGMAEGMGELPSTEGMARGMEQLRSESSMVQVDPVNLDRTLPDQPAYDRSAPPPICESAIFAEASCSENLGDTLSKFVSKMLEEVVKMAAVMEPEIMKMPVSQVLSMLVSSISKSDLYKPVAEMGIQLDDIANCDFSSLESLGSTFGNTSIKLPGVYPSQVLSSTNLLEVYPSQVLGNVPKSIDSEVITDNLPEGADMTDFLPEGVDPRTVVGSLPDGFDPSTVTGDLSESFHPSTVAGNLPQSIDPSMVAGLVSAIDLKALGEVCTSVSALTLDKVITFEVLGKLIKAMIPSDVKFLMDTKAGQVCPGKLGCCDSDQTNLRPEPTSGSGAGAGSGGTPVPPHGRPEDGPGSVSGSGSGSGLASGSGAGVGGTPNVVGKNGKLGGPTGKKNELRGKVKQTKDKGGTREKPSDKLKRFTEKLGMADSKAKAEEHLKSLKKDSPDVSDKTKGAMREYTKDTDKFDRASKSEKKGILASMLRALLEGFEDEVEDDGDGKKKPKGMTLSQGKDEFLKFFPPASEKAKACLKDDIEVIEPGEDVDDAEVELTKKSIYCTMDDGEVCGILDTESQEIIKIGKSDDGSGEFIVTRDGFEQDCGENNKVETTCEWATEFGRRYMDFGSALLSGEAVDTVETTPAPTEGVTDTVIDDGSSSFTPAPTEGESTVTTDDGSSGSTPAPSEDNSGSESTAAPTAAPTRAPSDETTSEPTAAPTEGPPSSRKSGCYTPQIGTGLVAAVIVTAASIFV